MVEEIMELKGLPGVIRMVKDLTDEERAKYSGLHDDTVAFILFERGQDRGVIMEFSEPYLQHLFGALEGLGASDPVGVLGTGPIPGVD